MKCINCGNEIPNSSNVCPFCNSSVTPIGTPEITTLNEQPQQPVQSNEPVNVESVTEKPVESVQSDLGRTSQIPVTPTEPVLPQDQGMEVNNVLNQDLNPVQPETNPIIEETIVENPVQPEITENTVEPMVNEPVVADTPVMEDLAVPQVSESEIVDNSQQIENQVVEPVVEQPVTPVVVDATMTQEPVTGEPVMPETNPGTSPIVEEPNDGVKIGAAAPVIKKNNKKPIIIVIVAIVVALIVGFAAFFYIHEFKSGNKKLDALVDNLFAFTNNISNETVKVSSGKYDVNMSLNDGKNNYSAKLNGSYGVDIDKKIMNYKINVESINVGQELIPHPLKVEMYSIDSKLYFLLENFYDKYIYYDVDGMEDFYTSLKENDINYQLIIQTNKNAFKNSLKAMKHTEEIATRNINGKDKKVNVLKIQFTKDNQKIFIDTLVNTLINSEDALKEMAKLTGETVDDLKKSIKELSEDIEYLNEDTLFEIYTPILSNDYEGIKAEYFENKDKYTMMITPEKDSTKMVVNENNKEVLSLNVKNVTSLTKDTKDTVFNLSGSITDDKNKYTFELAATVKADLKPNVVNVNVRNSINYKYLTQDDIASISIKISNYGALGRMLAPYLSAYTMPTVPDTSTSVGESTVVVN